MKRRWWLNHIQTLMSILSLPDQFGIYLVTPGVFAKGHGSLVVRHMIHRIPDAESGLEISMAHHFELVNIQS